MENGIKLNIMETVYQKVDQLIQNNQLQEALKLLENNIKINQQDANLYVLQGVVYRKLGDYAQAVSIFQKAIFYDKNVDFIVIVNDLKLKLQYSAFPSNVKFFIRDNIGFDFGGWSDALLTNDLYKNYKYFIFANASIIGPFNSNNKWTDIYINGLQENNIKLFGSTINCQGLPYTNSHVQSYIFSMDIITLEYLIKCGIFTRN